MSDGTALSISPQLDLIAVPEGAERQARLRLVEYLQELGQTDLEKNVEELLTLSGGFLDRFNFFMPHLDTQARDRVLVSGCAVGSELVAARNHRFREAFGTEVTERYVRIASDRLAHVPGVRVDLYDGRHLPYPDNHFSTILSGHIIEHTGAPYRYFAEHMRVLRPGGFFFIEFPDRYHSIELHTGLPSYEYLPAPLRGIVLRYLASPLAGFDQQTRRRYEAVRSTLTPVSIWQIRLYLLLSGNGRSSIVAIQRPAPGFTRLLIRKT